MPPSPDYYKILGVPKNADATAIRNAFRALAKRYHPDINRDPEAEERFKEINEAYSVLSDDQRRAVYDQYGVAGLSGMPAGAGMGMEDLGDLFEEFFRGFGMGGSRRTRRSPRRGADLQVEIKLSFLEAAAGLEREAEFRRHETCTHCGGSRAEPGTSPVRCPTCNGSGEVRQTRQTFLGSMVNVSVCPQCSGLGEIIRTPCKTCSGTGYEEKTRKIKVPIPSGVDQGTRIRLSGEGEPGLFGGPTGDLYILILVMEHEFFHRRGYNVWMELSINYLQAALGAEIRVPILEGETSLRIPPGTQPGAIFRLRGKGIQRLQKTGHGDLFIVLNVQIPSSLSSDQKKALTQLGLSPDATPKPQTHTLLDSLKDLLGD